MLSRQSFAVFEAPSLTERLGRIQQEVDPDFEVLGQELLTQIEPELSQPRYLHIAKHLRRHKNPPVDTWLALSTYQRGYKMLPHFEVGLWPDRLFITLSLLADLDQRTSVADWLAQQQAQLIKLPISEINFDHTNQAALPFNAPNLARGIQRYQSVKKAELTFGRWLLAADPLFNDPKQVDQAIKQQISAMVPFYRDLLAVVAN